MSDTLLSAPKLEARGLVAWSDTDASGWIHFTAALRWVENAEHAVYRELGIDPGRFPRKSVEVEYNFPFHAGMDYHVRLHVERFGRTSLTWGWSIYPGEETEKPAIVGRFTAVYMGIEGRPTGLPVELEVLK